MAIINSFISSKPPPSKSASLNIRLTFSINSCVIDSSILLLDFLVFDFSLLINSLLNKSNIIYVFKYKLCGKYSLLYVFYDLNINIP
jgi:hypothetical protein